MSAASNDKKPGFGSFLEPIVLIVLGALFGTCTGGFIGGRVGRHAFEETVQEEDPAKAGAKKARKAGKDDDVRLKRAFRTGLEKGKADKLEELEEEIEKLAEEDREIWNATIEKSAVAACTSFYMKGINDGEKEYESAFRWEYQVPRCTEGIVSTSLCERIQLYHGKIPLGNPYEREISKERWGDCASMRTHYVDVLKKMRRLNVKQGVEWKVEKKEIEVTRE